MFTSGHFLTTKCFVELVRAALACTDVDQRKDGDHSLRTGAAITAVERGFEDSVIKTGKVGKRGILAVRAPFTGTTDGIRWSSSCPVNSGLACRLLHYLYCLVFYFL